VSGREPCVTLGATVGYHAQAHRAAIAGVREFLTATRLRSSAQRGRPFGSEDWVIKIAVQLGPEPTMNSRGHPKRS
jgi:hypothetical protein